LKKTPDLALAPSVPVGDLTYSRLEKTFGAGVVRSGDDFLDEPEEYIGISPAFNEATGGGLKVGSLFTLAGPSGCGKTTLALHMAAKWQAAGGDVFYIAAEHKILHRDLTQHKGLITSSPRLNFIRSYEGKIMTAADFLQAGDIVLADRKRAMLIVDSFSVLSDSTEMADTAYGSLPPGGPNRLVSRWCRKNAAIIPINGNVVIGIAQVHANIGGKKKWAASLPGKVTFARSGGLYCSHTEPILAGSGDEAAQIGQSIHWVVERSACGPSGRKFTGQLRYGVGIDDVGEAIELAEGLGLVTKGGSWLSLDFLDDPLKFQGREKAFAFLSEHPDLYSKLETALARYLKP
jgi:recombination protein RecA